MKTTTKRKSQAPVKTSVPSDDAWNRWVLQTARRWSDVDHLIKKTGLEAVDSDHRQLTEIALEVNNLIDLVDTQGIQLNAIQEQGKAISSMYEFAKEHFEREIGIIKFYGLPGLEVQLEQHDYFLNMMQGFLDDFHNGRLTASMLLKNSVLDWWVNHINHVDHDSFNIENWTKGAIKVARQWSDVEAIIKTTDIETLDQEHRQMTEIALELAALYDKRKEAGNETAPLSLEERALTETIVTRLIKAAKQHFANEETFIQVFELHGIKTQQHQHAGFLDMLSEARTRAAASDPDVLLNIRQSILHWWITHINEIDYKTFSLDKWAHVILTASTSWDDASDFIRKTGEQVVDEDHEQITVFMLEFDALLKFTESGEDPDIAQKKAASFFRDLYTLVENHFCHEEALMTANKYLLLDMHKGQHKKFLTFLQRIQQDIEGGRLHLSKSLKRKIFKWWIAHIREYDLKAFNQDRFGEAAKEEAVPHDQ